MQTDAEKKITSSFAPGHDLWDIVKADVYTHSWLSRRQQREISVKAANVFAKTSLIGYALPRFAKKNPIDEYEKKRKDEKK